MPDSNAISSQGAQFYKWTGSDWGTAIAEITSITGPNKSRATIEVTTLNSTDRYREFVSDLLDGGDVVLAMNYTRATYNVFDADLENPSAQNYAIVLPDGSRTSLEIEGLVTEVPLVIPVGDKISSDITIKVTGKPAMGSGSSALFP